MTFYEVLKEAIENKAKIRLDTWSHDDYIYYANKQFYNPKSGDYYSTTLFSLGEQSRLQWSVYNPPLKFSDLKIGEKFTINKDSRVFIRIPEFGGYNSLSENGYGVVICSDAIVQR